VPSVVVSPAVKRTPLIKTIATIVNFESGFAKAVAARILALPIG
jgi:hypothetical protein